MDSTTSCDQFQLEEMDVLSLYHRLEQVSDHRQKRGVRYPLALVLSLVILGKLAGMTSLAGIAEWVRWRADQFQLLLPCPRASLPCASTHGKVLRRVEAEEITRLMAQWLTRLSATWRCGSEPSRLRTSRRHASSIPMWPWTGKPYEARSRIRPPMSPASMWWRSMKPRPGLSWPSKQSTTRATRSRWKPPC